MAIFTFFLLLIFFCFSYMYYKKDILGPGFLFTVALFIPYLIIIKCYDKWEVTIYPKFVLCISIAILSWLCGSVICRLIIKGKAKWNNDSFNKKSNDSYYRLLKCYPDGLFCVISTVLFAVYIYMMVGRMGSSFISDIRASLRSIYIAATEGDNGNFILSQVFQIITSIAYLNTFKLFANKYLMTKKKRNIYLIIPIILFLISTLVSTDRNILLRFIVYAICIFVFFYRESFSYKRINKRLIKKIVIIGIISLSVFWLFGYLKGYKSNFVDGLEIYGGSGLYNFNLWIEESSPQYTYGSSTLHTFKQTCLTLLSKFGLASYDAVLTHGDWIAFKTSKGYIYVSNIYSALKNYYLDFGYGGLFIFPFLYGLFYECLYQRTLKYKNGFSWFFYGFFISPIFYMGIADRLLGRFHLGLLYECFWTVILYKSVYGKNGLWKYRFSFFDR